MNDSIFLCLLLSILFVGSLYIWNLSASSRYLSSNISQKIIERSISTIIIVLISPIFININIKTNLYNTLLYINISDIFYSIYLLFSLYLGHLYYIFFI